MTSYTRYEAKFKSGEVLDFQLPQGDRSQASLKQSALALAPTVGIESRTIVTVTNIQARTVRAKSRATKTRAPRKQKTDSNTKSLQDSLS
jgi:hypothetical protein